MCLPFLVKIIRWKNYIAALIRVIVWVNSECRFYQTVVCGHMCKGMESCVDISTTVGCIREANWKIMSVCRIPLSVEDEVYELYLIFESLFSTSNLRNIQPHSLQDACERHANCKKRWETHHMECKKTILVFFILSQRTSLFLSCLLYRVTCVADCFSIHYPRIILHMKKDEVDLCIKNDIWHEPCIEKFIVMSVFDFTPVELYI